MGLEAAVLLVAGLAAGFLVFAWLVGSRWRGDWLWLESWGDRVAFYVWPRAPGNVVRITMPNGDTALLYNVRIREKREGVTIETPLGLLRAPERGSTVLPLTGIYLHGRPSPVGLVVFAIAGLVSGWIAFYYSYLLLGFEVDAVFASLAAGYFAYIYLYYQAASTSGVEYHEYEVRGLAPPFLHAIPSGGVTSPVRQARYLDVPIVIRVTRTARESMDTLKRALGVESESEVAELLAMGEFTETVMRKAAALKAEAARVEELFGAFRSLQFRFGPLTLGRAALLLLSFAAGLMAGWALGGGAIAVGPPPELGEAP